MISPHDVAAKYGLLPEELANLLRETDGARGLLTPQDLEAGLAQVLAVYIGTLKATAERIEDSAERLVVERFLSRSIEGLAGQLEGAGHVRS